MHMLWEIPNICCINNGVQEVLTRVLILFLFWLQVSNYPMALLTQVTLINSGLRKGKINRQ